MGVRVAAVYLGNFKGSVSFACKINEYLEKMQVFDRINYISFLKSVDLLLILSNGGLPIHYKKPSPSRSERDWGGDERGEKPSPSPLRKRGWVGGDRR